LKPKALANYRQERTFDVALATQTIHLVTRPGFPAWGHVSQAAQLIAGCARIERHEHVLVYPCGHGALGVWAAMHTSPQYVTLRDTHFVALEMARRTLAANQCGAAQTEVGFPAPEIATYDVVMMLLPKGRDLTRLLFLYSLNALREGGRLYLAGANDEGIKSAISDGEALLGPSTMLAYKGGNRVVSFRRGPSPDPDLPDIYRTPGLISGTYTTFQAKVRDESFHLRTRPGVFAWRGLDTGTEQLLEVLDVRPSDIVLDVGCGYGVIGMYAARRALRGQVTLVDVDALACECARASLAANGLEHIEVLLGDGLAAVAGRRFTLIVSNPPFHSGHSVDVEVAEAFVREAYAALEPRGRLVLVANRFLPYDQIMTQAFGDVTVLLKTGQYHVLSATKIYQRKERGKPTRAQRRALREEITDETLEESSDDW
jgi:16S rRNA (guanine1207-N2)-methyltransferase